MDAGEPPILVDAGVIETSSKWPTSERLLKLHDSALDVLATYQPSHVAVEALFFARNVSTAITVGQARGVVLLAAAQRGLEVADYTPTEIKLAVAGYGNAEKAQVQEMVKLILGLDDIPRPDDAADAVAAAICCLHAKSGYGSYA